ncbi:MAG: metallophosphoesterase [Oscillospiraceae bacterium]
MLYAIGDLHLSLEADKPMDVFGPGWENHTERLKEGFSNLTDDDTTVICGDISWSMSIEKALLDFKFIDALPGRKIVLKGNHDYWWTTAAKAYKFFENNDIKSIDILNNNCYFYGDTAICGTRGWFYEEETHTEHDRKIMNRELTRLELSLKAAGNAEHKLCFFHYPPRYGEYVCGDIIRIMEKYGVKACWYGHIHGPGIKLARIGNIAGIEYSMVSADYVDFKPVSII